jgi:hypothetical protein
MCTYLKFGFMHCPDTDQLARPQCAICAAVLGNEAMKASRITRHTNNSYLVIKSIEIITHKRDARKNKIISPNFNHCHFAYDGILFNNITDA